MEALVIFGATGDLTKRKLLPALYKLQRKVLVIGVGRREKARFRDEALKAVTAAGISRTRRGDDAFRVEYHRMDYMADEGYERLARRLKGAKPVFYLATQPEAFATIAKRLAKYGLDRGRIVFEKPFGRDLASARRLNDALKRFYHEEDIYRIDHYVGKESVQNLLVMRFANSIFEPLWNYRYIDHIQITVAEQLGVGSRAGYYEQAGALRDMVQNHLLQILMYVTMEPPSSLQPEELHAEKTKVLKSLCPLTLHEHLIRGQYTRGTIDGKRVRGYLDEEGVGESRTETFVAMKLRVNNWRWRGMPIYVRTGKRLPSKIGEVIIRFRSVPFNLFGQELQDNTLRFELQPHQGIQLRFMAREPRLTFSEHELDFCHDCLYGHNTPEAYEQLLKAALDGDRTLFTPWEQVEHAWSLIDNEVRSWQRGRKKPLPYKAGTWGPKAANDLIEQDGRRWLTPNRGANA